MTTQNRSLNTAPSPLRSFLIDAGAQYNGYAADITRTYSARDDDFASMIVAMNRLQLELCAQVKSGIDYANIHLDAHQRIGSSGRMAEFVSKTTSPRRMASRRI